MKFVAATLGIPLSRNLTNNILLYYISLRKVGDQNAVDLVVLDNTGSTFMTLHENDLALLDLAYGYWGCIATLSTANGNIDRNIVEMG